jgi:hypothetical protein
VGNQLLLHYSNCESSRFDIDLPPAEFIKHTFFIYNFQCFQILKILYFIFVLGGKNGSTEFSKENKTVPGKVATTRTEDGHKQNTKTSVTI